MGAVTRIMPASHAPRPPPEVSSHAEEISDVRLQRGTRNDRDRDPAAIELRLP
jgi:hypothetical protein